MMGFRQARMRESVRYQGFSMLVRRELLHPLAYLADAVASPWI
jgi:hypothetical protein